VRSVINCANLNHVKYFGVIFDKRTTWRLHIDKSESKALRTFIRIYSLFKSERLKAYIKVIHHKALIRSVMIYACPAWEFAADTYLLKLQRLQNKVLHTIENFQRCTPVRDLNTALNFPYVYDYIIKLCRQKAEVIQNHENEHFRSMRNIDWGYLRTGYWGEYLDRREMKWQEVGENCIMRSFIACTLLQV
jgi:hypothetical protein